MDNPFPGYHLRVRSRNRTYMQRCGHDLNVSPVLQNRTERGMLKWSAGRIGTRRSQPVCASAERTDPSSALTRRTVLSQRNYDCRSASWPTCSVDVLAGRDSITLLRDAFYVGAHTSGARQTSICGFAFAKASAIAYCGAPSAPLQRDCTVLGADIGDIAYGHSRTTKRNRDTPEVSVPERPAQPKRIGGGADKPDWFH